MKKKMTINFQPNIKLFDFTYFKQKQQQDDME